MSDINNTTIYLFSGLGADKSVFEGFSFLNNRKHKFIEWERPKSKVLEEYALQLSSQIDTTQKVILIGVSFGGMLVSELSKHIKTEEVILISSASTPKELPFLYRVLGKLKLYFFIPTLLLNKPNRLLSFAFGVSIKKYIKERKQLSQIIKNTNPKLAKSFIKMIMTWKDNHLERTNSILRIHGDKDMIIPAPKNCHFIVKDGAHFMILTHLKEIDLYLQTVL
ncbi:serine aminopeptidase domain-containing protein [Bernardetia sp.]|uniref:serine aminopeptidase domain-containing protein n=1 Tax=Bernardetia sp. TaxID=1937974 RepID=UPI0025BE9DA4|nr:alpha/beta hydrolase [Bernardetia sp.]